VDTRSGYSRLCFDLGWGVIADGRMAAVSIVEHLKVLEDVPYGFVTGRVASRWPIVHQIHGARVQSKHLCDSDGHAPGLEIFHGDYLDSTPPHVAKQSSP